MFTSKTQKKNATDKLNREYSKVCDALSTLVHYAKSEEPEPALKWEKFQGHDVQVRDLSTTTQRYRDLYNLDLPFNLHQYRPKHSAALVALGFGVVAREIEALVAEREVIKAEPVVKPEPKRDAIVAAKQKSLLDIIAKRKEQYGDALDIGREFGGLPVSMSWCGCQNQHGTTWVRHWFYLDGKLTPLSIIMAAAGQLEREGVIKSN